MRPIQKGEDDQGKSAITVTVGRSHRTGRVREFRPSLFRQRSQKTPRISPGRLHPLRMAGGSRESWPSPEAAEP